MSTRDEILRAIGEHGTWRDDLIDAIRTGLSSTTPDRVADDTLCAFGRWLALGPPGSAELAVRDRVIALHANFHIEAASVLALALAGQTREAEQALAPHAPFVRASQALTRAMKDWLKLLPKPTPGPGD